MSSLRRNIALVAAAVFAVLALGAGVASAHTARISSQHTLAFTPDVASDVFSGQLTSSLAPCTRARAITLFRVVGGASTPDAIETTATTNTNGVWTKGVGDADTGDYYAVAVRKVIQRSGHRHVCKPARSNTVTVEPSADLAVSDFTSDPDSNGVYTYGATVSNNGPSAAKDVVVTIGVPSNFTVTQTPMSTCVHDDQANTITCDNTGGSTDPNVSDSYGVDGRFTSASPGNFTTTVTSSTSDPNTANNSDSATITPKQCADGSDNDLDGQTDYPNDPGCAAATGDNEANVVTACSDGIDNDGDTKIDFPADPGCISTSDPDEVDPAG